MVEGEGIVETPGLHETAHKDHAINDDCEDHPRHDNGMNADGQATRKRDMRAAVALSRHRGEILACQPEALGKEGRKRETQQDDRQDRGARRIVLRTNDSKEDFRRQDAVCAAKHQRVAEIRHAFDEADEKGIGETGLHQRQGNPPESAPAVGAQRLRGFFHGGAYPFDYTDQHQKRDGRERKNLRDPDAGHAIKPATRLDAEEIGKPFGDDAGAAEEQRQGKTDNERRRYDWQHRQEPQSLLEGKARAGGDQGKAKAEHGRTESGHQREEERAPGNTAALLTHDAAKAPYAGILDIANESIGIKGAVEILNGRNQHTADRIENQNGNGADDKGIALHDTTFGKPEGKKKHEDERHDDGPRPHGRLAIGEHAEEIFADCPGPAGKADGQPLQGEEDETSSANECKQTAPAHRITDRPDKACGKEENDNADQPWFSIRQYLQHTWRIAGGGEKPGQPAEAVKAAFDAIPGKKNEGESPERQDDVQPAIATCHGRPRLFHADERVADTPASKAGMPIAGVQISWRPHQLRDPSVPAAPCAWQDRHRS